MSSSFSSPAYRTSLPFPLKPAILAYKVKCCCHNTLHNQSCGDTIAQILQNSTVGMRNNLFVPSKMEYARGGKRPDVECILCSIVEESNEVARLDIHRSGRFVVALNLYPYTPGHLMVFPKRHIADVRMLNDQEAVELHELQNLCLDVLESVYQPHGFNIGYNMGEAGGASIEHLHLHIVPRYRRETGFIDIIAGSKIIIEDPKVSLTRMREAFAKMAKEPHERG